MTTDLAAFAKDNGIKYFMITFTDLFGYQRAKLVPAQVISDVQKNGAGFAGFATWMDMTPAHPDMLAVPDPDSVVQLPWRPEVAWVASNCIMEGQDVAQAPRNVLRRLVDLAASEGIYVKTGIEPEFTILTPEGDRIAAALGRRKLAILRNHGLLTVGTTVDAAAWWFITADRSCQAELLARAAGTPTEIDPATAALTHSQVGSDAVGAFSFHPLYCWIVAEEPDLLD